jgi:hypothetical protein
MYLAHILSCIRAFIHRRQTCGSVARIIQRWSKWQTDYKMEKTIRTLSMTTALLFYPAAPINNCGHGGSCVDLHNGFRCVCRPGWTGPTCTQDVDKCTTGGCAAGRSTGCINTPGSFRCLCGRGFTGPTCEDHVDECSRAGPGTRCAGGATCLVDLSTIGFRCLCPPGCDGPTCSKAASPLDFLGFTMTCGSLPRSVIFERLEAPIDSAFQAYDLSPR